MSWLSSMFGGGHNPSQGAMGYLDQIKGEYGNPDLYNQIAGQYKESPGYQARLRNAMESGNNAAAAGGMLGSNQHQFMNASTANDIASQDFQNYMQNRMGLNQDMGSVLGQKAGYSYAGGQQQNQNHMQLLQQLMGLLGGGGLMGFNHWLNKDNQQG